MSSVPTKQQLAQHLCLSLNTHSSTDWETNWPHEVAPAGACARTHSGACCHCWAAANVMMPVMDGVASKARDEMQVNKPDEGSMYYSTTTRKYSVFLSGAWEELR